MKYNSALWNYYAKEDFKKAEELFNLRVDDFISATTKALESVLEHAPEDMEGFDEFIDYFGLTEFNIFDLDIEAIKSKEDFDQFISNLALFVPEEDENGNLVIKECNETCVIGTDDLRLKCGFLPVFSVALHRKFGFFKPLFYCSRYDIFMRNCELLGISLPALPAENDYHATFQYYYEVCEVLDKVQKEKGFTDEQMTAYLYDFAPRLADDEDEAEQSLPDPRRIWITCAGSPKQNDDFKTVDSYTSGPQEWSGNKMTSAGDIVLIYCVKPRSYIHSIWRATSGPHYSPFSYRKSHITIGHKVEIPPITLNELRQDEYMGNNYVIRKNFMGTHGDELTPTDYKNIVRMIGEKGFDTSLLPKFYEAESIQDIEIKKEQHVSDRILVPFFEKLGFKPEDYKAELELQLGREVKAGRPDFTFFPKQDSIYRDQYKAPFLIEVKKDMANGKGRYDAVGQGLSYARILDSSLLGIADKYSFILFKRNSNGVFDIDNPIFEESWNKIYSDDETYGRIRNLLDPAVIKNLKK